MNDYYMSMYKGQVEDQAQKSEENKSYSQVLLRDYLNAINNRQGDIAQRKEALTTEQEQGTGFNNLNLKPILAFADSMNNTRMAQSYDAPESAQEKQLRLAALQNAIAKEEAGLVDDRLNVARLMNEDERVRDRTSLTMEQKTLDRGARQSMLNQKLANAAGVRTQKAQEKASNPEKFSADQSKAAGFARRIEQTDMIFDDLVNRGYQGPSRKDQLLSFGPNEYRTPEFRQYDQATRNFINATLRRESGAAISKSEFTNAELQYLPMPGDDLATLEQKKINRAQIRENLKAEAQGAYDRTPLESPIGRVSNNKKTVRVTNGSETLEINREDLQSAMADGYREVK